MKIKFNLKDNLNLAEQLPSERMYTTHLGSFLNSKIGHKSELALKRRLVHAANPSVLDSVECASQQSQRFISSLLPDEREKRA